MRKERSAISAERGSSADSVSPVERLSYQSGSFAIPEAVFGARRMNEEENEVLTPPPPPRGGLAAFPSLDGISILRNGNGIVVSRSRRERGTSEAARLLLRYDTAGIFTRRINPLNGTNARSKLDSRDADISISVFDQLARRARRNFIKISLSPNYFSLYLSLSLSLCLSVCLSFYLSLP